MGKKIWIVSYPRSGVQFLRHCIEAMSDVKTYSLYDSATDGETFVQSEVPDDDVCFVKTHQPRSVANYVTAGPIVHLVRDGRDAMTSHARYLMATCFKDEPEGEDFDKVFDGLVRGQLREEKSLSNTQNWGQHTLGWMQRKDRIHVKFEDLILYPETTTRALLFSLDILAKEEATIKEFDELRADDPRHYRRGVINGFSDELTEAQEALAWQLHGHALKCVGYKQTAEAN
ncbi:MAG: sulfotransferase domain-containing protein [Chloroflexi bacterium]|nr:sulfotransferase domain-containing protein [Chloroflexota bacterium]